jgi:acyl-CoA synthetase (AMP-forming)/AMP-acid ligase II
VIVIKSGGEKVSALEIERELLELPQIAEAAVVGLEDEEWGQKVAVAVVLSNQGREDGFTLEDMREAMKARVAVAKVPKDMRILPIMPRSQIGKVNKKTLIKEVWGVEK